MRTRIGAFLTLAALMFVPATSAQTPAPPQKTSEMSLAELVQRRDLWPARVTLRKDFKFGGGVTLRAGKEVGLSELRPSSVVVDTGEFLFDCAPAETDVVERARALIAALTPEQLALTFETLRARPELWPLRVAIASTIGLADGSRIEAGQQVALRYFERDEISVYHRQSTALFTMAPWETDLLTQARERLKLPAGEREPFFIRSVEAALEKPADGDEHPLAKADFLLFYKARKGCSRCSAFTPELKQFYARMKAEHPRFELIFLSSDNRAEDARAYLAETKFPGRVIAFERTLEAANTASLPCQLLPGVFIVDRTGKVLEQNHPNGGSPGGRDILAKLEKLIRAAEKTSGQ